MEKIEDARRREAMSSRFFFNRGRVRTFCGWTPGLRMLLRGRVLPCGCLVGTYETLDGAVVSILDARGERCAAAGHLENVLL